ncbi:hypothetical protein BC939DRAFT_435252, partial [Gamsiella multidivaricata]|uniref:uncharacterized protein n=1 Tax=Gamsiella multidivaricata TaxID=101098 RepID=UPI00221E79FE
MASFDEQIDAVAQPICRELEVDDFLREMDFWSDSVPPAGNTSSTNPDIHTTAIDFDYNKHISDAPRKIIQVPGTWAYGYTPAADPLLSSITASEISSPSISTFVYDSAPDNRLIGHTGHLSCRSLLAAIDFGPSWQTISPPQGSSMSMSHDCLHLDHKESQLNRAWAQPLDPVWALCAHSIATNSFCQTLAYAPNNDSREFEVGNNPYFSALSDILPETPSAALFVPSLAASFFYPSSLSSPASLALPFLQASNIAPGPSTPFGLDLSIIPNETDGTFLIDTACASAAVAAPATDVPTAVSTVGSPITSPFSYPSPYYPLVDPALSFSPTLYTSSLPATQYVADSTFTANITSTLNTITAPASDVQPDVTPTPVGTAVLAQTNDTQPPPSKKNKRCNGSSNVGRGCSFLVPITPSIFRRSAPAEGKAALDGTKRKRGRPPLERMDDIKAESPEPAKTTAAAVLSRAKVKIKAEVEELSIVKTETGRLNEAKVEIQELEPVKIESEGLNTVRHQTENSSKTIQRSRKSYYSPSSWLLSPPPMPSAFPVAETAASPASLRWPSLPPSPAPSCLLPLTPSSNRHSPVASTPPSFVLSKYHFAEPYDPQLKVDGRHFNSARMLAQARLKEIESARSTEFLDNQP